MNEGPQIQELTIQAFKDAVPDENSALEDRGIDEGLAGHAMIVTNFNGASENENSGSLVNCLYPGSGCCEEEEWKLFQ